MVGSITELSSSSSFKFNWKIENFSKLNVEDGACSDVFSVGGFNWEAHICPKGNKGVHGYLSLYLKPVDLTKSVDTEYNFTVTSKTGPVRRGMKREFSDIKSVGWGWPNFMGLSELHSSRRGYIVNDTCVITVEVTCKEKKMTTATQTRSS